MGNLPMKCYSDIGSGWIKKPTLRPYRDMNYALSDLSASRGRRVSELHALQGSIQTEKGIHLYADKTTVHVFPGEADHLPGALFYSPLKSGVKLNVPGRIGARVSSKCCGNVNICAQLVVIPHGAVKCIRPHGANLKR